MFFYMFSNSHIKLKKSVLLVCGHIGRGSPSLSCNRCMVFGVEHEGKSVMGRRVTIGDGTEGLTKIKNLKYTCLSMLHEKTQTEESEL